MCVFEEVDPKRPVNDLETSILQYLTIMTWPTGCHCERGKAEVDLL